MPPPPFVTMTLKDFLWLSTLTIAVWVVGCAVNPVTRHQPSIQVSENEEILIDRHRSPHQVSADHGAVKASPLLAYVIQTGIRFASESHRISMPYPYRIVNAALYFQECQPVMRLFQPSYFSHSNL